MNNKMINLRRNLTAPFVVAAMLLPLSVKAGTVGVHTSNPYPPGDYAVSGIDEANVNSFDATVKRDTGTSDKAIGQTFAATSDFDLDSIVLMVDRESAQTLSGSCADMRIDIVNFSGTPRVIHSENFSVAGLAANASNYVEFAFSGTVSFSAGGNYGFAVWYVADNGEEFRFARSNNGGTYGSGNWYTTTSTTFSEASFPLTEPFVNGSTVNSRDLLFGIKGAGAPSNDEWFANLRTTRVASDPSIRWRQFGPGMSGNNYRLYWHPTDPAVVYLGPNMGQAYRSIDKGTTYETMLDWDGMGYKFNERGPIEISSPDFSRSNPNLGFCTKEVASFLYKTIDKGKTWQRHVESDSVWGGQMLNTLCVDPSNDQTWYVGSGSISDINHFTFTAAKPNGDGVLSGHLAKIWKTTNQGTGWSTITPAGLNTKAQIVRIIVHPANSALVYAATTYGFYASTNGGASWTLKNAGLDNNTIRSMDSHYDAETGQLTLFVLNLVKWAANGSSVRNDGGGLFKSPDGGTTWQKINGDLGLDITQLAPNDYTFRTEYFSALNNWFGITNAASVYTVYPTNLMHSFLSVRVDPNNVNKMFLLNDYKSQATTFRGGMLWRSDNGGTNWIATLRNGSAWEGKHQAYWASRNNPTNFNITLRGQADWAQRDSYEQKAGGALDINADSSMIMYQWAKVLCVSTDGGDTWVENDEIEATPGTENWVPAENSNLPGHGFRQDARHPEKIYLPSGENDFWVTTPDGANVRSGMQATRRIPLGTLEYSCSDIAIHPDDTNTLFSLQFRQTSAGKLLKSTDGGTNFSEIGTAIAFPGGDNPKIHQLCLTIDPVATNTMYFCIPSQSEDLGYVGDADTASFGVRKSNNGGVTWSWANSGLPANPDVACIRMDPVNSAKLYACVYGSGGGLFVSTNNATNWTQHPTFPTNLKFVQDLHFAADGKIYVSCGSASGTVANGGVWVSADGGTTWSQLFKMPWARMTKTAAYDPEVILVQMNSKTTAGIVNPGTYLSKDGGASWAKINVGNPQSDRVNDIAIDLVQSNVYYVSTYGTGWLRGDLVDTNNVAPAFVNSPVVRSNAVPAEAYAGTIEDEATDANSDPIAYSLVFGPDWLSVAANGLLSGTPPANAPGLFVCQVQADDGHGLSARETLNFLVSTNPSAYYASWISGYPGIGSLTGLEDDPDGDRLQNLSEYGLGGNPGLANAPAGIKPAMQSSSDTLNLIYRRRTDAAQRGLTYTVETTTNLVAGSWTNTGTTVTGIGPIDAAFESVTNAMPIVEPSKMMRLRIGIE